MQASLKHVQNSTSYPLFVVGAREIAADKPARTLVQKCTDLLPATVQHWGYRELQPLEFDLLTLAVGISFADRLARRREHRWERSLRLHCTVYSPEIWNKPDVRRSLIECLRELTGDYWNIKFVQRAADPVGLGSGPQLKWSDHSVLIPYSDGLDSLATYQVVSAKEGQAPLALTVRTCPGIESRILAGITPDPWAPVKLVLGAGKHAETTFRSRAFLFLSVAAVLARLRDLERIMVPETGQGAIGAALTPFDELIPWGSHPHFTRLFGDFLNALWLKQAPRIEHPNLWKTKAELLAEMVACVTSSVALNNAVRLSRSCTNPKPLPGVSPRACGVCPNCLLRRVALVNGGFSAIHRDETYVWKDLNAPNLTASLSPDLPRVEVTHRHEQIARSAVIAHRELARLADRSQDPHIREQASLIAKATGTGTDTVAQRLQQLLERHKAEWRRFIDQEAGTGSWLRKLCE